MRMRRGREEEADVAGSPSSRRSRTDQLRPNAAPSSRRASRLRRSLPIDSPSRNGRSRCYAAPETRSKLRRGCGRASRRNDPRAPSAPRDASLSAESPLPRWQPRRSSPWSSSAPARAARASRPRSGQPRSPPEPRRSDADEDVLRVANPPRRHGTSASRGRPLLRGLAAELGRRARADRDVQRRPERDALGRGFAGELHRADRHARAGGRQPGLIGREGARRPGPHGLIRLTPIRRRSAARPAGGRGRGGS